jgi:hypothetical protein
MYHLQKAGGVAGVLLGALFVGYLILLSVVLPALGVGPGTLNDPSVGIPFIVRSWLPIVIGGIYMGIAVAFGLLALALYERLQLGSPAAMRAGTMAGIIASGLFLIYAMIQLVGAPAAISVYQHDSVGGGAIYLALRAVANAVNAGALFAAGWALALAGWSALRSHALPGALGGLMICAGAAMSMSFVLLPIGLLGVLIAPLWSLWLGIWLLRGK